MHKLWLLASTVGKGLLQCVLIVALTFLFCRTIPGDAVDVLGLDSGGTIVKPLREELKESAALPYVRTAKAKGLAPLRIAVFHILPNAAGILLSLSGLVAGSLVAGTLTMEILFGLPGIGSLALNAIQGRDTPVVLAAVSFIAVSLVLINTAVDALHKLFDPRMTP